MRFYIYANPKKDVDCVFTKKIVDFLCDGGNRVCVHERAARFFPGREIVSAPSADCDVAIVVGGDGTILSAAVDCAKVNLPVFGFNLGHVGFLTEGEPTAYADALRKLQSGKFKKESRALLRCRLPGGKDIYALNDVVVERSTGKMITVKIFSNGSYIDSHRCDGFIVSTPTGSTAYSLSAGGPIVSPTAEVLALTPINSHSLHSKPMIVGKSERITVSVESGNKITVFADGKSVENAIGPASVQVEFSNVTATFLRTDGYNFYEKLLKKLNTWSTDNNIEE